MSRGFTLIQLSLLLTVTSLTLVACLPALPGNQVSAGKSFSQMNTILTALRQYESANARLPCPADASQPTGSSLYGMEAAGNGASGNCTGGSPAANNVDTTNHIAVGMVPVRALGLPNSYATDAWGRTITYAVDTNATSCFQGSLAGALTITDSGSSTSAVAALVSHGPDGHGAWVPQTGAGMTALRLNGGSTDAGELANAHVDANFNPTQPLKQFVRQPPTQTFNDVVAYNSPLWNLSTIPAAASKVFPSITVPASATYITGQTLSFTITYPQTVTVSGSPALALTVGSSSQSASYQSGSGTSTLTFRYTVQSGDYAPSGIGLATSLNQTSGTVNYGCNTFSVPSLTGVTVKNLYLYVTDSVNERVEQFSSAGAYLAKFGSLGLANGQFTTPRQPAIDASGNVWVTDFLNGRVQAFTNSVYAGKFGSIGILNGQFTTAGSIAIDGSGNFWVADEGGNRVEKFSSTGAYLAKFGSAGILNGQFAAPTGIAIDSSNNLWVGDFGNSRVEKFSSGGVYMGKLGSLGSGNGQFINPCGNAIDPSGNIWVVDSGNNRVQKFDANGNYLAQFGSYGTGNSQFASPCGIAIDVAGNLWVVDSGNNRVQKFSNSGSYLGQFGGYGTANGKFITPGGIGITYQ